MTDTELNALLREGENGARKALRQVHGRGDSTHWLTSYLLRAIETGAIPSVTYSRYLDVCRDPQAVRAGLEQPDNVFVRAAAIRHFVKLLCSEAEFRPTWNEVGGASGLVDLMRQFSVAHVNLLCHRLGCTGTVPAARVDRQQALSELLHLLCGREPGVTSGNGEATNSRDPRPLRKTYLRLLKSCTAEVCMQWQDEAVRAGTHRDYGLFYGFHTKAYQAKMLHDHFQPTASRTAPVSLSVVLEALGPMLKIDKRFSLTILEKVVEGGPDRFILTTKDILDRLAIPFLGYLQARKGTDACKERVWSLVFTMYAKWTMFADQTTPPQWWALLRSAIFRWKWASTPDARRRSRETLCSVLELPREIKSLEITEFVFRFLYKARLSAPRRYELMCLFLQHYKWYNVDIDTMSEHDQQKLQEIQDIYPCDVFTLLPLANALRLLETLIELKQLGSFVRTISLIKPSILALPLRPDSGCVGMDVLHCFLRHQSYGNPQDVEDMVNYRIAKATQSRDWKGRAFWSKSALFLSIASGSLEVYSKTLVWTRRFHRDHKTVAVLYGDSVLGTSEGLRLLAGIPISSRLHLRSLADVEQDISAGNRIISQLLEAVVDGLDEAGISTATWAYITSGSLAWDVCVHRLTSIDAFQGYHGLSDDDIFKFIWEPTIQTFIEVEAFALREKYMKLNFGGKYGLVNLNEFEVEDISDHTWRFFNELARGRDELWARVRLERDPAVSTLSSPWPKGLPTHFLSRIDSANITKTSKLPYVVSRAKAVVFADPISALTPQPEDDETQVAIGGFSEDYNLCLRIYLKAAQDQQTRISRTESAWNHATNELTGERMSQHEAHAYWWQWVKEWVFVEKGQAGLRSDLAHVHAEQGNPTGQVALKPRYLDPTCLDSILVESPTSSSISQLFEKANWPQLTHIDPPKNEVLQPVLLMELKTNDQPKKEAFITRAVQLINAEYASDSDSQLMMKPFPSGSDTTSSAPDHGIEHLKMDLDDAFQVLERFHSSVPVHVIRQLARSAIRRVVSQEIVVRLIRLLAESNRPWEACPLISDIVLDGQRYSSWQRHLFSMGFLNRLPAQDANKFVRDVGNAIATRLEAQSAPAQPQPFCPDSSQQPIKITTVKMLAEVIRTTKALDTRTGTAVLLRIFLIAKHVDVRAAVIQGLLKAFDAAEDDELRTAIFVSLQRHAIHVASSINERHPMSEKDWIKAEVYGELPEIPQTSKSLKGEVLEVARQISNLLIEHIDHVRAHHPEWMERWTHEIIEKILFQSIENNTRWMKLFVKINDLSVPDDDLPTVPVDPSHYNLVFEKCSEFLTMETFNLLKRWVMFKVSLPGAVDRINESIRKNSFLIADKNAQAHWNVCCGKEWGLPSPVFTAGRMLEVPPAFLLKENGGAGRLTIHILQGFLIEISEVIIMDYPLTQNLMNELINDTHSRDVLSLRGISGSYQGWLANLYPVIEHIVGRIESISENYDWKTDPNRVPKTIPKIFGIKLKMLARHSSVFGFAAEGMLLLCSGLYTMIDGLAERAVNEGLPYHDDWKQVKAWVHNLDSRHRGSGYLHPDEFVRVAVMLWEVVERGEDRSEGVVPHQKLTKGLVFELFNGLIRSADDPSDLYDKGNVLIRAKDILDGWAESLDVRVRDAALETLKVWEGMVVRGENGIPGGLENIFGLFD